MGLIYFMYQLDTLILYSMKMMESFASSRYSEYDLFTSIEFH